jgi:hypothetical protein
VSALFTRHARHLITEASAVGQILYEHLIFLTRLFSRVLLVCLTL